MLEARLTEAGVATVRAAIEAAPALAADGDYRATLRPGAEPIPHGVNSYRFDVEWAAGPVLVTSWDPASLSDQVELWIFPPEMAELADLATRLADPVTWLGEGAFVGPPAPYVPTGLFVRVDLYPDIGDIGGTAADVDDVEWPSASPSRRRRADSGEDVPAPRSSCSMRPGAGASEAEAPRACSRDTRLWETVVEYGWERADGFVQVTVRQLLPHQTGSCRELPLDAP